jgi:FAD/FMN-containing dehydrogenase
MPTAPGELERAEAFGGRILELCVEVGGTITGEHGVGIEKLDQMCVQFAPRELRQFHALKAAFDPDGLLNPGKAVPTLHALRRVRRHARPRWAIAPSRIAQVLKPDISRLNAGALGTLGVLLDVSIKVVPKPPFERTVVFGMDEGAALARLTALGRTSLSITATAHDGERLYVRVCGGEFALEAAEQALGGETLPGTEAFWASVREHTHPFFDRAGPLWRVSVPPAAPPLGFGETFLEWGGAERWLRTDAPAETLRARAAEFGGHAVLFRGHDGTGEVFHPLPEPLLRLHRNIKQAMDPAGILNPHRMYQDF